MHFGVMMFATDYSISPVELGRAVEDSGFESIFFPEHTHIPASRRTPWPGGADLPQDYWHTLDPFIALGAVASVTATLKLGTGICLVIERDPILLAKEVATLDFISGGRVLFGIGGGWNYEEMEHHGTNPRLRWQVLRERILAMKELWTKDEAEFHGRFVDFSPSWAYPKPIQKPHPPILVGGNGARTFDRIIEYGDEWMPNRVGQGQSLADRIQELQQRAKDAGRGPIPVSVFGARPDPATIEHYAEIGVTRVIFGLPAASAEQVLPVLARCAEAMRAVKMPA
jgi:probable F420-dependent oxidoreductase